MSSELIKLAERVPISGTTGTRGAGIGVATSTTVPRKGFIDDIRNSIRQHPVLFTKIPRKYFRIKLGKR